MKRRKSNQAFAAMSVGLAAATLAVTALRAYAQDTATNSTAVPATPSEVSSPESRGEGAWQFGVTLPIWAPQIDGDVTVHGHKEDVNISFHQLKDHLDASFSLGLQAQKDRFGLFASGSYMKFSGNFGPDSAELKFGIVNAGLSYVLLKAGEERPLILAATAGIRYWYADESVTIVDQNGVFRGSKTENLYDPVIGLIGSQYLMRKLHLDLQADVGGFDISHDTDLTWSATGVLSYDPFKWLTLSAGYSALALNESEGSGASKNELNLIFHGALIKVRVNF